MANNFEKRADNYEQEQKKKKGITVNGPEEKRTTFSLSLTVADKRALKMMALEQDTTIAAIVHGWITEHTRERGN